MTMTPMVDDGPDRDRARARASAEIAERHRVERAVEAQKRPPPRRRLFFDPDRRAAGGPRWHLAMKRPVRVESGYLLFTLLISLAIAGLIVGLFWNA